jgi:hypothetical protein
MFGDQTAVNYAVMFRFSIVGFMTSGLFLGRQYFDYVYTIIALICVLKRVSTETWSQEMTLRGSLSDEEDAEEGEEGESQELEFLTGAGAQ